MGLIAQLRKPIGRKLRKRADAMLDADRPQEAWQLYQRMENYLMYPHDWWMRGVCALIGLGDYQLAMRQFEEVNKLHGPPMGHYWVLDGTWVGAIGHIGSALDYVVKKNLLEGRSREDLILYLPRPHPVANPFLLQQYLPYLTIANDPSQLPFPEKYVNSMSLEHFFPRAYDGSTHYYWEVGADVQRRWDLQQAPPLLIYPSDYAAEGWRTLERLGVPQGAPFVTLHVREDAYYQSHRKLHALRNSDPVDYLHTIADLTSRGLWVIRVGDRTGTPLPKMPRLIDYPHMGPNADWLDIFLLSHNLFHIGSPSGVSYVPGCYGKPSVFANYWPPLNRPWHARDLFIPKVFLHANGTPFTLHEMTSDPYRCVLSQSGLTEPVTLRDSDPEETRLAAVEMLERIDGTARYARYSDRDEHLATAASVIQETNRCYGSARIARDFLRRNPQFVDMSNIDQVRTADRGMRVAS